MDIVRCLQDFNAGRDPERLQMKYRNMRTSPFVFLRGTCHLFYQQLPRGAMVESAPPGWLCGDLHLENFGSYKGDNRLAYFDINDFDEAVLAPVDWDLVRMLTSVRVGAESISASAAEAQVLCGHFLDSYAGALAQGEMRWVERDTAQGLVGRLLTDLQGRLRADFLNRRTDLDEKGRRRTLRLDGKKALPVSDKQREQVTQIVRQFAERQPDPAFYKVLDVARRIAGTGSLGLDRYAILVKGKGSPDRNYLLDLKHAKPSALLPYLTVPQPKWKSEAHRVVALQRRVQAVSMAFLQPLRIGKQSYVLRALQPSEDRVTLDRSSQTMKELERVLGAMGRLTAWDQLRSAGREGSATADELIAFGQRKKWRKQLLDVSKDCAAQVRQDWQTYSQAYDDKAFKP